MKPKVSFNLSVVSEFICSETEAFALHSYCAEEDLFEPKKGTENGATDATVAYSCLQLPRYSDTKILGCKKETELS